MYFRIYGAKLVNIIIINKFIIIYNIYPPLCKEAPAMERIPVQEPLCIFKFLIYNLPLPRLPLRGRSSYLLHHNLTHIRYY